MPPEAIPADGGAAATARARVLWAELAAVYDGLETHLASGAFAEAARLTPRLAALEAALEPVWADVVAARRSGGGAAPTALAGEWRALDDAIGRLHARCAALTAEATAARAATLRTLAAARVGRSRTRGYAAGGTVEPRFTSRRI